MTVRTTDASRKLGVDLTIRNYEYTSAYLVSPMECYTSFFAMVDAECDNTLAGITKGGMLWLGSKSGLYYEFRQV